MAADTPDPLDTIAPWPAVPDLATAGQMARWLAVRAYAGVASSRITGAPGGYLRLSWAYYAAARALMSLAMAEPERADAAARVIAQARVDRDRLGDGLDLLLKSLRIDPGEVDLALQVRAQGGTVEVPAPEVAPLDPPVPTLAAIKWYLGLLGWNEEEPGRAGALWNLHGAVKVAVPHDDAEPGLLSVVIDRIARVEHRTPEETAQAIAAAWAAREETP